MSLFEIGMLVCFGAAWPVSILRSWKSRSNKGKSPVFLIIVLIGYIFGTLHKIFYSRDAVMILYIINGTMVMTDLLIYYRNYKITQATSKADS